jgi:hypothetical protein
MRRYMCEEIEEKNLPLKNARRPWRAQGTETMQIKNLNKRILQK